MLKKRTRRSGKTRWAERGQALVEFGLVAVVFFTMLFGILDLARLFESWMSVQHASREGARFAITGKDFCDNGSITLDRPACIKRTAKIATTGLTGGGVNATDAAIDVKMRAWDFTGTNWKLTADANAVGKECDQIEVKVSYTHRFMTPVVQVFAPSGIRIHGSQRMTNEPFYVCSPNDGTS